MNELTRDFVKITPIGGITQR